ncbi:MAG: ice-binding family protein [Gallionella sp.]|nr:ice-binding family protein [Gallionella sp.]
MNKFEYVASGTASYSTRLSNDGNQVAGYKPLKWLMSLLLVALVTGCGGGDGSGAGLADTTAPTISSTAPANTATAIALNANITATFSEAMDAATINTVTFTLTQGGAPVAGAVTYVGTSAIFNPTSDLAASTVYTATVTTGVKDVAGNALAVAKIWSFTTGTTTDATAPTVSSTVPVDTATGVAVNANITATFSEVMDASTITTATFTLAQGATPVAGAVTYVGTTAIFNPTSDLTTSLLYTATVTTGAKDIAGNALAAAKTWSFTTGTAAAAGPAPVVLGGAGNFVMLTKTGITNTGSHSSAVTGDIGSSPITAAAMDNVFCSEMTGSIYGADAAYTGSGTVTCFKGLAADITLVGNAVLDMETAYTDAAGRSLPDFTELYAGDISGKTLVPGLYKWGTGVSINTNVTLNGGPNDVWIFQIAGDLTQANGTSMLLLGGALPKNIFWQVGGGTGVTIGTTAHFEGVILATKAITLNTGASGNGRLLAQTAVTLDSNAVTQPAP